MTENDQSLESARDRIRQAYDPELLKVAAERLADRLARHLKNVQASQGRALNWELPADNIALAAEVASKAEADQGRADWTTAELVDRFQSLVDLMLSRGQNLYDPRYVGHQVPASLPIAGLFDAVGSVTNQVMAIYEMGPWATATERAMVERLGQEIGWKRGEFAGVITHGGTLANLNGLLVARNVTLKDCWEEGVAQANLSSSRPPVLLVQGDAHYSLARAAGILGLGTKHVIKIKVDSQRRMDVNDLDQTLSRLRSEGHPIVAVAACACSTPIGAFDPLNKIADVCERHQVWLHVDAAHGGSALLSKRHRGLVAGLERADSLVWDAHKMLFVPALCAFVFFKRGRDSFEAFRQNAPYLFDPSALGLAEYDVGLRTFECTKRAAAFGLWGAWSLFGRDLFGDMVDVTFDLARQFHAMLTQAPDFVPLHSPECNIVAFRHVPPELKDASPEKLGEFQRRLRRTVIESGEFYLVATNLDGIDSLRITIMNPLTTPRHLDDLLNVLRRTGRQLLTAG